MSIETSAAQMRVRVKVFATLARRYSTAAAGEIVDVLIPAASTVAALVKRLGLPPAEVKVVFVNGRSRPQDWVLQEGDEVGIFPPIGGG